MIGSKIEQRIWTYPTDANTCISAQRFAHHRRIDSPLVADGGSPRSVLCGLFRRVAGSPNLWPIARRSEQSAVIEFRYSIDSLR